MVVVAVVVVVTGAPVVADDPVYGNVEVDVVADVVVV